VPGNSTAQLRLGRLRAQRLIPDDALATPVEAVRHLIGVQAQIPSAAALAVRLRTADASATDVARGSAPGGPLVRTWLMRGTLHIAADDDLAWLLAILAAPVLRASRRRHDELGLDSATLARSAEILVQLLESGPATRTALFAGLADHGIDPAGQRGIHLIRHAALHGLLCCGHDQGREQTWVLRDAAVTATVSRDQAMRELASRYRVGYGPAGWRDLAAWSGLPGSDAQHAWRLAGKLGEQQNPTTQSPTVRLLPHFDPYLLGYAGRDHAVAAEDRRKVWTGGGYVLPTVTADGWAVGTWRAKTRSRRLTVTVSPFNGNRLGTRISAGIESEVADLGRFLEREASWSATSGPV
jgi:hypothetical protein